VASSPILLATAIAVGIHVAVVLLLAASYVETRSPYVAWWMAGGAALAARAGVEAWSAVSPQAMPALVARSALLLAGSGFFITGAVARDPRARGVTLAGFLGFGGVLFATVLIVLIGRGDTVSAGRIAGLGAGAALLLAAEGYRRAEQTLDDPATRTTFAGLLAAGANFVGWAWLVRGPQVVAASELLGGLCMLLFGAGIVLHVLQRARRLVILSRISASLQQTRPPGAMLAEVLEQVGALLQVHAGWAFLLNPESDAYELAAAYHLPRALEQDGRAAMSGPCRCLDLLQAGQLTQPVNIVNCLRLERVGIRAQHASVPLRTSTGIAGLLNLQLPAGRLCTQRELALLSTVGSEVGLAIEKARLLHELQEKERARSDLIKRLLTAHEDERRRIARELHDETGQALTALILTIDRVRALTEQGRTDTAAELAGLRRLAEGTLEEVRRLIYDLRPTILDDLGLTAALRWYVQQQIVPRGLDVDLHIHLGDARLDATLETAVFRIAQEALWNTVKHAGATRVEVEVTLADGRVRLRVMDNGRGFPADASPPPRPLRGGVGLGGMQERAALLGGRIHVASAPGRGTEVVADLPVPVSPGPEAARPRPVDPPDPPRASGDERLPAGSR
jgi:signal transduction histidine kinase